MQAKLGDLNVSKIVKKGLSYTQTGTPYYASPEVWRDMPYDSKSDIWSLGCVLYEMLTARAPFAGDSPVAVAYKHVQEPPVPPSLINPNIPPALESIDLKLLAKDPS